MAYETKGQILDRLNKTSQFQVLEPLGPVRTEKAEMPIIIALKAIVEAAGLKPGKDCEVTDFTVKANGIELEIRKGNYELVSVVPDAVGELFSGGRGTNHFDDEE